MPSAVAPEVPTLGPPLRHLIKLGDQTLQGSSAMILMVRMMVLWDSLLQIHECQHRCLWVVSSSHGTTTSIMVWSYHPTESFFRSLLGLSSDISQAGKSDLPTLRTALAARLISGLSEPASINWEQSIDAGSNLNSKTLSEILCTIGLDNKEYLLKKPIIDHRLLGNRNAIAHGERRPDFGLDDYAGLNDDIVQLVEKFRTDIENAAATRRFRR